MTADAHPRYPNPTIQEAICDIHFRLQEGEKWDPSWYGQFARHIEDEYPNFQPVVLGQLQLLFGQAPPVPAGATIPLLMRFQHPTESRMLQLSDSNISVNVLPIYPGWDEVSRVVSYSWTKLAEIINPAAITRVGLRYINRIERSSDDEVLEAWLRATEYTPAAILRARPGFKSQTILSIDDDNRVSVVIGDQSSMAGSHGAFIFDIDRLFDSDIRPGAAELLEVASRLHEDVWTVFKASKGDRLEELLQGDII